MTNQEIINHARVWIAGHAAGNCACAVAGRRHSL